MSDKRVNGEYLPEGIYMEATELANGLGNTYHSYLVYRDGQGNAEVIRGGFDPKSLNFDLVVNAGVDISTTRDAYTDKTNFDQNGHVYAMLDIGDKNPKEFWDNVMVPNAQKIDTTINYTIRPSDIKVEHGQVLLHANSVVCHSVVGTVLEESGISVDDAINAMHASSPKISEDSLRGIRTDLFRDDLDRGLYDETIRSINNYYNSAKESINNVRENINEAIDNAKNGLNIINNLIEKANEVQRTIDSLRDIFNGNIKIFSELQQDINNLNIFVENEKFLYAQNNQDDSSLSSLITDSLSISTNELNIIAHSSSFNREMNSLNNELSKNSNMQNDKEDNNLNTHMA